jgi:hypothetical protein
MAPLLSSGDVLLADAGATLDQRVSALDQALTSLEGEFGILSPSPPLS